MKAVEAIFNQEKALVVPFSVITNLVDLRLKLYLHHRARRYPGQLPPPRPVLQPRRPALPPAPALAEEWRRIGSRRSEFLHLGMPRRIVVHPQPHSLSHTYLQTSPS